MSVHQISRRSDNEAQDDDVFNRRQSEQNATNKFETLMNLVRALVGTGIYAMPLAFSYVGLLTGIISTILTAIICTHGVFMLLKCTHKLCRKLNKSSMTYPEVVEAACDNGPDSIKPWGRFMFHFIGVIMALTYFGTCSVYTVIVAQNFEQLVRFYGEVDLNIRVYIAALLIPTVLLCWIPHLKKLAKVSVLSNCLILVGLIITFYYCFTDMPPVSDRPLHTSLMNLPSFYGIAIFAMEAIGVVIPLENKMKNPQEMMGTFGVLNIGMIFVTLLYGFLGFIGFSRYGNDIQGSITLNLPIKEKPAQIVKLLIALAVFLSIGLQFYVLLEIIWNRIENKIEKHRYFWNYLLRTTLISAAILLAVAVPTIGPFVGLLGAFCFSIGGLLVPAFLEVLTSWDEGFGKWNWIIWKNIIFCIFGCVALIMGTKSSIEEIIKSY